MKLWSDEVEAARDEIRGATSAMADAIKGDDEAAAALSVDQKVAQQRAIMAALEQPVEGAVERIIAGVPCRVLVPEDAATGVYLHFHGGGMILGRPAMNDATNHHLMTSFGLAVVSVDYRLAPEHPHPAGPDDGEAVAAWLIEQAVTEFGTDRLLIGGESAGGYMAAITLLRVRDRLGAIDRFVGANLVFGVYDWGGSPSQRGIRPSRADDILSVEGCAFFTDLYLPDRTPDQRRDPQISPAFANLADLPPALFTVGTADHLLDDTLMLSARWGAYGSDTELLVYPDAPHGFMMFGETAMARHWAGRTDAWFEQILATD